MKRFINKKTLVIGMAVALVLGIGGVAFAYFTSNGTGTGSAEVGSPSNVLISQIGAIYDSTLNPLPGDMPASEAFDATGTTAFGNEITLKSNAQPLDNVVVTMSDWACESGGWNTDNCVTTFGDTYSLPITLTLYDVSGTTLGSQIATDTQTFNIPYRPSTSASCTGANFGCLERCWDVLPGLWVLRIITQSIEVRWSSLGMWRSARPLG